MKPISLQDVRRAIAGRSTQPLPKDNIFVSAVCTDSRDIRPDSLYIAIKGDRFDAHDFIVDAAEKGAIAAIVSTEPTAQLIGSLPKTFRLMVVADTRIALGKLAGHIRTTLRAKVVAVAGSNGKTGTKYLINSVLSSRLKGSMSPKSFNNDIGVPLAINAAEENHDYLVLELGTNHLGEISNLTKIAQPDIAVITNCTAEHLEFLGSVAGVRYENGCIIEKLNARGALIVNGDDADLLHTVAKYRGQKITFGFNQSNDLFATDVQVDSRGVKFKLNGRADVYVPLLGKHSALNALAAIAVGKKMRLADEEIIAALATATGPEMRLEMEDVHGVQLINDAYNANPASMISALETLKCLSSTGRKIAVLGDMLELGQTGDQLHQQVGLMVGQCGLHLLMCVGKLGRHIGEAAIASGVTRDRVQYCDDADAAAAALPELLRKGDIVLIKASRSIKLEKVAMALKESSLLN